MNNKYDLSILIPARNEMFVAKTVEELLKNKQGNTEIIVGLDGEWADPSIPDHKDVTLFYIPAVIGQRAMTNQLCRLSKAKYVMKLDAHCAVDEGFDVKLMADMQEDWTQVPVMRNLHVFDWVCENGHRRYQSPSGVCKECGKPTTRDVMWIAKESPRSTSFCFDTTMHFQYFNQYKKIQEATGSHLVESMSLQGSCFMMTRKKYWELNICDEAHGSWGQQGVEVALKTWLSGGKIIVNKNTWYAHMFRTQGGDFSFPYPMSGRDQEKAREYSRDLWLNNKWPMQIHTLQWLLDKFKPPYWTDEKLATTLNDSSSVQLTKSILFYTDNQLKLKYAYAVQNSLRNIGLPIVSVSLKDMAHFGTNIHLPLKRGMETYFKQIITGLEKSTAEYIFMCEHDVIYHPSHFNFIPPTKNHFYYNLNFWRIRPEVDTFVVRWDAHQVSGLCASRELLLNWYTKKWEKIQKEGFDRSYEPGGRNSDLLRFWKSDYPNIDIRHGNNLTKSKWSLNDFRDKSTAKGWQESTIDKIPGWDLTFLF